MSEKISFFMKKYQDRIEGLLLNVFPKDLEDDPTVKAAMYSLLAGGKRIRPVLMYMVADMLKLDLSVADDFAVAMEMPTYVMNSPIPIVIASCKKDGIEDIILFLKLVSVITRFIHPQINTIASDSCQV